MRDIIVFSIVVFALVFCMILGCSKTEVIDMDEPDVSEEYTPRTKSDSTEVNDSVPITFSVSVEGWKEVEWE